jgi:hypothetical protein
MREGIIPNVRKRSDKSVTDTELYFEMICRRKFSTHKIINIKVNSFLISTCHHILQGGTPSLTLQDFTYLETESSEAIIIYKPR